MKTDRRIKKTSTAIENHVRDRTWRRAVERAGQRPTRASIGRKIQSYLIARVAPLGRNRVRNPGDHLQRIINIECNLAHSQTMARLSAGSSTDQRPRARRAGARRTQNAQAVSVVDRIVRLAASC